jgi:hypothetical protein
MSLHARITVPMLSVALLASTAHGQCEPSGIWTPYGTETFELVEWRGHYYDA